VIVCWNGVEQLLLAEIPYIDGVVFRTCYNGRHVDSAYIKYPFRMPDKRKHCFTDAEVPYQSDSPKVT
jgi:hypothetical protein